MKHSELQDNAQTLNLHKIFFLLKRLEDKEDGRARQALEWCAQDVRRDGQDLEWAASQAEWDGIGTLCHTVQQVTGCDGGLVFSIGYAVFRSSRAKLLVEALQQFDQMYPDGFRQPESKSAR
jgi:hypothetical protein